MIAAPIARLLVRFVLLPLWFLGTVCQAQYSSNIQGVVADSGGAAINGAAVELRNVETGITAVTKTSDAGNYRFSSLPPGNYVVTAAFQGFRKTEARFTLNTSETKGINLVLPVGSTQESVTV